MFATIKARFAFGKLLSRPDIDKAYKLTDPSDSWYKTLKKVHDSLAEVKTHSHSQIEITSVDGLRLKAVCYPCRAEKPRGTVIFIHGYTSHAEREWAFPSLFYLAHGFNVIIPYQRAHGISEGKLITLGALERGDMIDWVRKSQEIFPDTPIVIHGLSMGGGIALQLCDAVTPDISAESASGATDSHKSEFISSIKCIVADAPAVGANAFINAVSSHFKPSDREKIRSKLINLFIKSTGFSPDVTDIFSHVRASRYPIYLTAGSLENMENLFEKLTADCPMPVETVILAGCNHGNGMYKQTEVYHERLAAFLDKYFDQTSTITL